MSVFLKKIITVLSLAIVSFLCVPLLVHAQGTQPPSLQSEMQQQLGGFAGDKGANLGKTTDPRIIAARMVKIVLGVVGTIAVIMAVGAGFVIMTASGNEEKVAGGKKTLMYSITGLVIILAAYSIVWIVYVGIYHSWQNPMTIGSPGSIYVQPNDSSFYDNSDPYEQDAVIGGYEGGSTNW